MIYTRSALADLDADEELAAFIEERFTPEFRTAFEEREPGGRTERGPFSMVEYMPPGASEAETFGQRADDRCEAARQNNRRGDDDALLTAMAQRDLALAHWVRRVFLILAIAVAVCGVAHCATFEQDEAR